MKKTLSILVMLLGTTSIYAVCSGDVDLSGNKITNLAPATTTGEAVTYDQVLKAKIAVLTPTDPTKITHRSETDAITAIKAGRTVCINGRMKNVSGATITANTQLTPFEVPDEMDTIRADGSYGVATMSSGVYLDIQGTTSDVYVYRQKLWLRIRQDWLADELISYHVCYIGK